MTDKETDFEGTLEAASLLPDRYYIVVRDSEEEGTLKMTAYDTTQEEEDDEYIPAGAILLAGVMELMENDFERVMNAGMARFAFQATQQRMVEESDEEATVERLPNSNIVKVDFGKMQ
tara:strand:- start:1116 stop:1469 length:354 start_codon:yes stop_codon:yes gene_type:complete